MIRDLDIDLLRTFVAVADAGGFTNAGRRINLTQSAVSMRVRRLEEFVGRQVFDRNGRSVRVTSDGEVLLRYARRLLSINEEAVAELIRPGLEGVVRLAIPDGYGTYFLPCVLSSFAQAHPKVQLEISCGLTGDMPDALAAGRLDLALSVREPDDPHGEMLWAEPIEWVAPEEFTIHTDDPLPLALFHPGCVLRARAIAALEARNRAWRLAFTSPSMVAIQAAVVAGLAIAVLGNSGIIPGMRALSPQEGFPRLPPSEIELLRAPTKLSKAAVHLGEHIIENLGAGNPQRCNLVHQNPWIPVNSKPTC